MRIKRYLENLIELCAGDNAFAAEALEVAVIMGWVKLGYADLEADAVNVMGQYDEIIVSYREWRRQNPEVRVAA